MTKPLISIITGSVRPTRFNIQPATWMHERLQARDDAEGVLLDLADINLPFLDEPKSPSSGEYQHAHTKEWARNIDASDGFILVTPEYNHSYSPVLKNALDFAYKEWNHKPVTFVSYGNAGGARAIEHLRGVAGELKLFDLRETLMLTSPWNKKDESGQFVFDEQHEKHADKLLDALVFWATQMKAARAELAREV